MIVDLIQNTEEWLEFRKSKIGASDIPVIMGLSPYSTPLSLWKRKLGFEESPPMHAGMLYGQRNESMVREMAQIEVDLRFDPVIFQHDEHEWAIASLDGYNADKKTVIEIKCCNKSDHEGARKGKIPTKYYPQLQWQYFVTDADKLLYCSYNEDLIIVPVERDDKFISEAFKKAEEFNECLKNWEAPPLSEDDYLNIEDLEFESAAKDWVKAKDIFDEAKKQEEYYRKKLIEFTDDSNCEGYGVRLTRTKKKGSIDMDKLCKDYKIDFEELEKYRKPEIGYFRVSKKK